MKVDIPLNKETEIGNAFINFELVAMNDREEWRERVRDIRATSTI